MPKKLFHGKSWGSLETMAAPSVNDCRNNEHFCRLKRNDSTRSLTANESLTSEKDSRSDAKLVSGDGDAILALEKKIDKLNDLFQDQSKLLHQIKEEIQVSKSAVEKSEQTHNNMCIEMLKETLAQLKAKELNELESSKTEVDMNSRARSFLDAIESRQTFSLDREIRDALCEYLQSDELRDHMVSSTSASVGAAMRSMFSRDLAALYLPVLERSHRRLLRHVTRVLEGAFGELEENTVNLSNSVYNSSRCLRRALEQHQQLLKQANDSGKINGKDNLPVNVEKVLENELHSWRTRVMEVLQHHEATPPRDSCASPDAYCDSVEAYEPDPPPVECETSIIDQMMMSAEINKSIREGDLNGSFTRALSAGDLSLVVAACRAADPAALAQRRLAPAVVLSLVQQLATDLVTDTQLKCRYLEEALLNLDTSDAATRQHLPTVVSEVRTHLTAFLQTYPGHVAHRRVTLIVMAANKLLQ